MSSPLDEKKIRRALQKIEPRLFDKECFHRNVSSKGYTTFRVHPLDAAHSKRTGNRYNAPGEYPALYLAHHATLASLEVEKEFARLGLPFDDASRVNVAIHVSGPFLDLTDASVRHALGIRPQALTMSTDRWKALQAKGQEAPTQILGRLVWEVRRRFGGIYCPSVVGSMLEDVLPNPHNLVVFMKPSQPTQPTHREVVLTIKDDQGFLKKLERAYLQPKKKGS